MTRASLAACAAAVLLLTGCSSDGGTKAASPATSAPGPTTTVRSVDTSFTGQDSDRFCSVAKSFSDRYAAIGAIGATVPPAQLRTVVQEGRTSVNEVATVAPAEIKPDVQVIANAFTGLFDELEKVDFDTAKVSVATLGPMQAPEFQTATVRFQAYLRSQCGITG